jgi:hypothetical protein
LKKTRRAVSIVSICPVEVLVLNMWDSHRHCDRDIIAALAENVRHLWTFVMAKIDDGFYCQNNPRLFVFQFRVVVLQRLVVLKGYISKSGPS